MADVTVVVAGPDDWEMVRDLRLAALADTPDAFGATHAEESAFTPAQWQDRLARPDATTIVAHLEDGSGPRPAGLMIVLPAEGEPASMGIVVGVWVAPWARGRGVSDRLLEAIIDAAAAAGRTRLILDVADANPHAQALYARHGFRRTGRTGTLPAPRTHVTEHELALDLTRHP